MREIEFRAWHPESKEMVYFDAEQASCDEFISCHFFELMAGIHQNGERLQQYTGLKDRNGVKIFEGDILEVLCNTNSGLKVEFINAYNGGWVLTHPNSGDHLSLGARKATELEVIGNIHENPELIK